MKLAQFYLGNVDPVNPQIAPVRMLAASPTILEQEDAYTALATAHLSLFRTNSGQALDYWFGQPQFYGYGVFHLQPTGKQPYAVAIGSLIRPQQANPRSPYLYRYVLLMAEDAIMLGGDWQYVAAAARPDEADLLKRIQPNRPAVLPDLAVDYSPAQAEAFQKRSIDLLTHYFEDQPEVLRSLFSTLFIPQLVIVQNLPDDDRVRADFAVALAAIWPSSLRSVISFALRVPSIEEADVQFKFLSAGQEQQVRRKSGLVYDFQAGRVEQGGERSEESLPYLEQAISALGHGAAALLDYQKNWDETAARLFRCYGDAILAYQYLDRWVALESAPDGEQWLSLLYDDQSLAEAVRVEEIRALADWLRQRNRSLPEGLLDVAVRYPYTESAVQALLAETGEALSEAMLAKLKAAARTSPGWSRFAGTLITDYTRRIETGEDAYRVLREFGSEEVLSFEALEAQVRLASRQRPTPDHAWLLLRVALKKATARQLEHWIEEYPGWLPPAWQAVFESGGVATNEALAGLPETDRVAALIKLGLILYAHGQVAALTPLLTALMKLAAQVEPPQSPPDESALLDRIAWDTPEALGQAAEWLIAAIMDGTPDDDTRCRLLWWYAQFRADTEGHRIDDLLQGVPSSDSAALVDRLLEVSAPEDNAFLVVIFHHYARLSQNPSADRELAFATLRRTAPNWRALSPVIDGLVGGLDTEDRLTEFDSRLIDSGLPERLMQQDVPARAGLLEWWARIFGIELTTNQEGWNQIVQWLKAAHPAIQQNYDLYRQYVERLQQVGEAREISLELAEYLMLQSDTRMVLERQWLRAIITAGRVEVLLAMARMDDLPLRLLKALYQWQTEAETVQTDLIAEFSRRAWTELSHEQIRHLRGEIEAYIVMLEALARPPDAASPVPEPKNGVNRLLKRVLQPQSAPSVTFPLLRKLAAGLMER